MVAIRRELVGVVAWGLALLSIGWPASGEELPDQPARTAATKLVRRLFEDDFKRAVNAEDKVLLARRLIDVARATNDDPAGRYVLLCEARTLADQAADFATALDAIDLLAKHYKSDRFEASMELLPAILARASPAELERAASEAIRLATEAKGAGRKAVSRRLCQAVVDAAEKAKRADLAHQAAAVLGATLEQPPARFDAAPAAALRTALRPSIKSRGLRIEHDHRRFDGHRARICCLAVSADGRSALSGAINGELRAWELPAGRTAAILAHKGAAVRSVAIAPRSPMAASASGERIWIWNLATGKLVADFQAGTQPATALAFDASGERLLSAGGDDRIRLWDVRAGRLLTQWQADDMAVRAVAMASDSASAVSGGADRSLRWWELPSGRQLARLSGHFQLIHAVAYTAADNMALSGGVDAVVRFWDLKTGRETRRLAGHSGGIHSVAFSPDVRCALSSSEDRSIRLWDLDTGRELRRFEGHTAPVESAGFLPDGQEILSAGDQTLRLWRISE